MTKYARAELLHVVSNTQEYDPASHRFRPDGVETTPKHVIEGSITAPVVPAAVAVIYDITLYTTVRALMLKNNSTTDAVVINYEASSGVADHVVRPGDWCRLTDLDTGTSPTVRVGIGGAEAEVEFVLEIEA